MFQWHDTHGDSGACWPEGKKVALELWMERDGGEGAVHFLTPNQARDVAASLNVAADCAEAARHADQEG